MNVRVNVFETPGFNRRKDWPPDDLVGFIAWFQKKLDCVSEPYKQEVNIDLEPDGDRLDLSIYYYRPETEEEVKARQEKENERGRVLREQIEANERREYERLKAKFGQTLGREEVAARKGLI